MRSELGAMPKLVAATLSDYMNEQGVAWPRTRTLARGGVDRRGDARASASVSERTVVAALDELVRLGWLYAEPRSGRTTIYHARFAAGAAPPLQRVQGPGVRPLQEVQGGLHNVEGTPAAPAPEVEKEEVQEDGHLQLHLEHGFRARRYDDSSRAKHANAEGRRCYVCGGAPVVAELGATGMFFCDKHRDDARPGGAMGARR